MRTTRDQVNYPSWRASPDSSPGTFKELFRLFQLDVLGKQFTDNCFLCLESSKCPVRPNCQHQRMYIRCQACIDFSYLTTSAALSAAAEITNV